MCRPSCILTTMRVLHLFALTIVGLLYTQSAVGHPTQSSACKVVFQAKEGAFAVECKVAREIFARQFAGVKPNEQALRGYDDKNLRLRENEQKLPFQLEEIRSAAGQEFVSLSLVAPCSQLKGGDKLEVHNRLFFDESTRKQRSSVILEVPKLLKRKGLVCN